MDMQTSTRTNAQFENRFTVTKKELVGFWVKQTRKKSSVWLISSMAILFFFRFIANLPGTASLLPLAISLFLACIALFYDKFVVSSQFKYLAAVRGADTWEYAAQISDEISVTEGNTRMRYAWNQIVGLIQRRDYFVLTFDKQPGLWIRLRKDAFIKGTPEAFLEYVKREHPGIRIRKKK